MQEINLEELLQENDSEETWEEEELDEQDFDDSEYPDTLGEILEKAGIIEESLKLLDKKFEQKIKIDAHKAEMFNNMHKELMQYKNGLIEQILNGIFIDIIQLIDSNDKNVELFSEKEFSEENYQKLLNLLKGTSEDLTDILYRQSVEPYSVDEIDVKRQKILQVLPTENKELDKTIAKRIVPGYEKDGKIIRPERISIYKFKESEAE